MEDAEQDSGNEEIEGLLVVALVSLILCVCVYAQYSHYLYYQMKSWMWAQTILRLKNHLRQMTSAVQGMKMVSLFALKLSQAIFCSDQTALIAFCSFHP